ncbi:hypothetical protein PG275_10395 [Riemerella anatipestifer]|nr:hypothetical protein [Riemerella anatipestifer]
MVKNYAKALAPPNILGSFPMLYPYLKEPGIFPSFFGKPIQLTPAAFVPQAAGVSYIRFLALA